jgi:hypothetical protein
VPLVAAAGAAPAGRKRIPRHAATVEEVFRVITVAAIPAARSVRTPFTERATNVAKLIRFVARFGFLSGFRRLQSVLKKPEHYRELQELQPVSSLQEHFFTHLRDARGRAHQTLSLLRLQPLFFGDLQGGVFVTFDHGAKLGWRDVPNYTAGFFDAGTEFF